MGNTVQGTVTKMLTLVPIVVILYYYDLPNFLNALTSAGTLAFFVVAVSLFALGVALKRRILAVRLEVSKPSLIWGLCLLGVATVLYVYGSYTSYAVWYHYESLYVFVIAYVTLRVGTGFVRATAPLLAIFAFSFLPFGLFPDLLHRELLVFLSADLIVVFFLAYVGLRASRMVLPSAILLLGVLGWYGSILMLPFRPAYLDILIPLPLLALLIPIVRRFAMLPRGTPSAPEHDHRLLKNGFCSICGLKRSPARTSENVGLWGLLTVIGVAALLLLTTIPTLALVGGVPNQAFYAPQGFSSALTLQTPPGWQINSTTLYKTNTTDVYGIQHVYVPIYHPETKNYTVYYELSTTAILVPNGPHGQEIPGWNTTSNQDVQFGPFQGHLTIYSASKTVMLAYQGVTIMFFHNGTNVQEYFVGLGFVREFKGTSASAATIQFLADLDALWLPTVNADASYSTWTGFLYTLDQSVLLTVPFLLLISSTIGIGWGVYRAGLSDDRLDGFLTIASIQSEEYASYLSRLLRRSHHAGTSQEVAAESGDPSGPDAEHVDSSMRELERTRLVRAFLMEREADIVSVWRTPV
jgi:hypothetical protein